MGLRSMRLPRLGRKRWEAAQLLKLRPCHQDSLRRSENFRVASSGRNGIARTWHIHKVQDARRHRHAFVKVTWQNPFHSVSQKLDDLKHRPRLLEQVSRKCTTDPPLVHKLRRQCTQTLAGLQSVLLSQSLRENVWPQRNDACRLRFVVHSRVISLILAMENLRIEQVMMRSRTHPTRLLLWRLVVHYLHPRALAIQR